VLQGQPSQVQGLRNQNRRAILGAIRRLKRTARVDIARETGISAATVTSITADLVAEGLVEEVLEDGRTGSGAREAGRGCCCASGPTPIWWAGPRSRTTTSPSR
jgi:hypothetical protein